MRTFEMSLKVCRTGEVRMQWVDAESEHDAWERFMRRAHVRDELIRSNGKKLRFSCVERDAS